MRRSLIAFMAVFGGTSSAWADSYRFLHVGPDVPWLIFLFLLPIVMAPFILMAILYWRFAGRKDGDAPGNDKEG